MDPITASVVVGLLAKHAKHLAGMAEDALDSAVKDGLARLWASVRSRLSRDPHAATSLDRMAEQPENELRQAALQDYLDEAMRADHDFASELARLAQPVTDTALQAQVSESGAVAVGSTLTISGSIAAGRDVVRPNLGSGRNDGTGGS